MHQYNSQATFHKNNTQDFIDAKMNTPECHWFLIWEARKVDSSRLEKKRRLELAQAHKDLAECKHKKAAINLQKKKAAREKLDSIPLVLKVSAINSLKTDDLKNQLAKLRFLKVDKTIPKVSKLKNKEDMRQALLDAVERHNDILLHTVSEILVEDSVEKDSHYTSDEDLDYDE